MASHKFYNNSQIHYITIKGLIILVGNSERERQNSVRERVYRTKDEFYLRNSPVTFFIYTVDTESFCGALRSSQLVP